MSQQAPYYRLSPSALRSPRAGPKPEKNWLHISDAFHPSMAAIPSLGCRGRRHRATKQDEGYQRAPSVQG